MPELIVSRSQVIHKPVKEVYGQVRRFENWPRWAPWLVAAPGFELEIGDDGFSWKGERCGAGVMGVLGAVDLHGIEFEMRTTKPRRSRAGIAIRLTGEGDRTEVLCTYHMEISLPVFWKKWTLPGPIGEDLERGLAMLKDVAETGVVKSRVEIPGREGFAPFVGVGIRRSVSSDGFQDQRNANLREVRSHYPEGEPFTVYEKRNARTGRLTYLTGVILERMPGVVADGMELFDFPGSEVLKVRHVGDTRHLGNAWAGGRMQLRAKRWKPHEKLAPFELYDEREEEGEVVRIFLPLK